MKKILWNKKYGRKLTPFVVSIWFQRPCQMKKLARRQAQELLHQTGRRLYSSNARPIENQSTGHIMAQGMNPESAVGKFGSVPRTLRPNGSNRSSRELFALN